MKRCALLARLTIILVVLFNQLNTFIRLTVFYKSVISLFLIWLFFPLSGIALQEYKPQIRNTLFNPLSWTHFPEFSNHKFYCMTEGKDSAIWFGTANGVVYYNGIKWRHYTTADGIIEGRIKSLLTAKDGSIYAASNEGLCRYVDTGWVKIDLPFKPVNPYTSFNMYETNDGGLWVPSEVGVLKLINDSVLVYKHDGVYIIKGKQISLPDDKGFPEDKWYDIEDSLVKYRLNRDKFDVCGICEDDNNNLYFGGLSKRTVATVSTKKITPIRYLHRDDEVQLQDTEYLLRLLHTNDNKLVVISENSLTPVKIYDLNNGNLSILNLRTYGGSHENSSIIQTKDGVVWIGGHSKIHRFKDGIWEIATTGDIEITSDRVFLKEALDGGIWVGVFENLIYKLDYTNLKWKIIENLNYQCETEDGKQWFISKNGEVVYFEPESDIWRSFKSTDGLINLPNVIFYSKTGILFAIGSHEGVAAISYFFNDKWTRYTFPEFSWSFDYRAVLEASDGYLYLGCPADIDRKKGQNGGLLKIKINENGNLHSEHYYSNKITDRISCGLAETKDKRIWMAGIGLKSYYNDEIFLANYPSGLSNSWIDDVINTPDGGLWVLQGGVGIFYFDNESGVIGEKGTKWKKYTVEDGLASNMVPNLLVSKNNTVWAATDKGISRFDGKSWNTHALPGKIKINREEGYMVKSGNGAIWINLASRSWYRKGRTPKQHPDLLAKRFYTIRYMYETKEPETSIVLYSKKVYFPGYTVIKWKGWDSWHSTPSDMLQYSYRLNNGEWSDFTNETQHIFLSLPSGKHTFEVKTRDLDHNIDPSPAKVQFYVVPPLYKRWWFLLITFILVSLIIRQSAVIVLRNRVLHLKNEELNEANEELKATQEQLVDLAHREGKADVASTVLHNVGNTLNSIKITIDLLKRKYEHSRVPSLKKVYQLFLDNADNLTDYLKNDPKGANLLHYFEKLSNELLCYEERNIASINDLEEKISFLEEFVRMQESFSENINVFEEFSIKHLIENTLEFFLHDFKKGKIELLKELVDFRVVLDRSKLSFVFQSVFKNILISFSETQRDNKQVILKTIAISNHHLNIVFIDNGDGFHQEQMLDIFQQNISNDKFGFGFHKCSILMKQLNCNFKVESKGIGKGSKYTLTLPYKEPVNNRKL